MDIILSNLPTRYDDLNDNLIKAIKPRIMTDESKKTLTKILNNEHSVYIQNVLISTITSYVVVFEELSRNLIEDSLKDLYFYFRSSETRTL